MPDSIVLDSLGVLLGQLVAELDEVEKDIVLLGKFSGSREEHRQFADSVRIQQRAAERIQQQLVADIEDCESDKRRAELKEPLEREEQRSRSLQRAFRQALLQYRPNAAGAAKQERELLLSGATTPAELRKRKVRAGNATLNAAADITTALQETVSMMDAEIEKSAGNIIAMQESSAKLKKTQDEYSTLNSVLRTSKSLIQSLEQADALDRWLMLGGLVLFALVVFNILRKRIWIPGLSTLFGLLRYLILAAIGRSGKDAVAATTIASSPLVTQQLAILATSTTVAELSTTTLITSLVSLAVEPVLDTASAEITSSSTLLTLATSSSTEGLEGVTISESESQDGAPRDDKVAGDTASENRFVLVEEPEEPIIDRRKVYTLPVERPVREEL
ncbi:Vesicle transport protein S20 [Coemansia sp. RSA 2681]|nr:Vesicle transport protein S20 [Coemansia sp. RSA 2681]